MNRFINLGVAKVGFEYEYESSHVVNKKTGIMSVCDAPRATTVTLKIGNDVITTMVSCSHKDHFSFEKGRKLALKKAFSMSTINKGDRTQIWNEYNDLKPGGRW